MTFDASDAIFIHNQGRDKIAVDTWHIDGAGPGPHTHHELPPNGDVVIFASHLAKIEVKRLINERYECVL